MQVFSAIKIPKSTDGMNEKQFHCVSSSTWLSAEGPTPPVPQLHDSKPQILLLFGSQQAAASGQNPASHLSLYTV